MAYPFGAFAAQSAGRLHPSRSAHARRQAALRAGMDARGEARRLSAPGAQGGRAGDALDPSRDQVHRQVSKDRRRGSQPAGERVLIDGEAVVLRPDGHSDFEAIRTKAAQPAPRMSPLIFSNWTAKTFAGNRSRTGARSLSASSRAPTPSCSASDCRRGCACVRQGVRDGLGRDRLKARRQHLLERPLPELDEGEEPRFSEEIDRLKPVFTDEASPTRQGHHCGGDALISPLTPGSTKAAHLSCHPFWDNTIRGFRTEMHG